MEKAVTVIMPAYNVTPYIATALDSVFAQSFRGFEVIVINDGCPDTENLERVLAPYLSRITYIKQANAGVGAARRAAVLAAKTKLIAQLDPDDWWDPDYLQVQLRLFEANPGVDFLYCDGYYVGDGGMAGKRLMEYAPSNGDVTFQSLMNADVNILYSAVIRRQAILNAGNFDPELRTSEDFHLWARMLMEGAKFAYHRAPLLHYRLRSTSLMAAGLEAQAWLQRALDKLLDLPLARDERAAVSARRMAVQMDMELARGKQALERKDWASARWHLEMYQRYRPNRKLKLVLFVLRVWPQLLALCFGFRNGLLSAGWLKANRPKQAEANS